MASESSNKTRASILVLDADDADRRFTELQIGKTGRFQVESASSAAAAIEILRGHLFDLILTEVKLADTDAYQLMKKVHARPGGKSLPFIFLTKDTRSSMVAAALQSGAVDFVGKPFNLSELLARMDAVVRRSRERRVDMAARSYGLAGDLSTVSFPDLIHLLDIGGQSGQLFFTLERGVGEICLDNGRVVDATFGNVLGQQAFYAIMREERGRFEFQPGMPPGLAKASITASNTSMLMEGARLLDMYRKDGAGDGAADGHGADAAGAAGTHGTTDSAANADDESGEVAGLPRPLAPSQEHAQALAATLEDPFSLAHLHYLNRGELLEFTASSESAKRCLGVVIAPNLTGVGAMAGMSAPFGEVDIASALDWDQRVLLMSLTGSENAGLDVILLNAEIPAMMLDGFRRGASFAIYAPSQGDHYSMGHQAHTEMATVLGHLRPDALMVVGNAGIETCLAEVTERAGIDPATIVGKRAFSEMVTDFREHLVEALQAWGAIAQVTM
ncbi:MAG: DUF4388 domain-containing protein [Planctomycetota bacterium]